MHKKFSTLPWAFLAVMIGGLGSILVQPEEKNPEETTNVESSLVRVMTYNIRYDNPGDGVHAWPNRKERLAALIRVYGAEVVGVQEALRHQLEDLEVLLPSYTWIGVGRNADGLGEYSAIIFREDLFEVLDSGTFWLSEQPDEAGSQSWDAALPRIVTWAHLRRRESDATFAVLNTHFDHRGEQARKESAKLITEKAAILAKGLPIIVMGDLNTTDQEEPYAILAQTKLEDGRSLKDAFFHARLGHYGPTSTWTGFTEIEPGRRIDYIWTSDDLVVEQHAILGDRNEIGYPSDHLPVFAEIELE